MVCYIHQSEAVLIKIKQRNCKCKGRLKINVVASFNCIGLNRFYLYLGRCLVQSSAGISAILTEVFCGFPLCVQANDGIVPQLGHSQFFLNPFQFIRHFAILHYIVSVLNHCSLNNLLKKN